METIVKVLDLAAGILKTLFFGVLAVNTIGVILFVAGVGLTLSGVLLLGIPVGILGMYILFKTDDML